MSHDTWTFQEIINMGYTPIGWIICASCRKYFFIVHKSGKDGAEDEHLLLPALPSKVLDPIVQQQQAMRFTEPPRALAVSLMRAIVSNQR